MATDTDLESGKNNSIFIVAMGDSLTAGYGVDKAQAYPALLERKLHSAGYDSRMISAGVNGEKSDEALARIDRVLDLRPDIVIVQTGTNDGLRGVAPEVMREILRYSTDTDRARNQVVLAGMRNLKPRKGNFDDEFSSIYPQVAARYGAILMPFFLEGLRYRLKGRRHLLDCKGLFNKKKKLVVCRNLTEANGGRIEVASEPGQGTTFAVVLPIKGGTV